MINPKFDLLDIIILSISFFLVGKEIERRWWLKRIHNDKIVKTIIHAKNYGVGISRLYTIIKKVKL